MLSRECASVQKRKIGPSVHVDSLLPDAKLIAASIFTCMNLTVFGYLSRLQIVPKSRAVVITKVVGKDASLVLDDSGIVVCQNGY